MNLSHFLGLPHHSHPTADVPGLATRLEHYQGELDRLQQHIEHSTAQLRAWLGVLAVLIVGLLIAVVGLGLQAWGVL